MTQAQAQGKIVQCIGAVVDVEFPRDRMPKVYDGACLAWLMLAGAATPVASPISGHLEFGWGA